jgi:hypothetical protein
MSRRERADGCGLGENSTCACGRSPIACRPVSCTRTGGTNAMKRSNTGAASAALVCILRTSFAGDSCSRQNPRRLAGSSRCSSGRNRSDRLTARRVSRERIERGARVHFNVLVYARCAVAAWSCVRSSQAEYARKPAMVRVSQCGAGPGSSLSSSARMISDALSCRRDAATMVDASTKSAEVNRKPSRSKSTRLDANELSCARSRRRTSSSVVSNSARALRAMNGLTIGRSSNRSGWLHTYRAVYCQFSCFGDITGSSGRTFRNCINTFAIF